MRVLESHYKWLKLSSNGIPRPKPFIRGSPRGPAHHAQCWSPPERLHFQKLPVLSTSIFTASVPSAQKSPPIPLLCHLPNSSSPLWDASLSGMPWDPQLRNRVLSGSLEQHVLLEGKGHTLLGSRREGRCISPELGAQRVPPDVAAQRLKGDEAPREADTWVGPSPAPPGPGEDREGRRGPASPVPPCKPRGGPSARWPTPAAGTLTEHGHELLGVEVPVAPVGSVAVQRGVLLVVVCRFRPKGIDDPDSAPAPPRGPGARVSPYQHLPGLGWGWPGWGCCNWPLAGSGLGSDTTWLCDCRQAP